MKCGEEKPKCLNCERQGEPCDYSIRLNWEGRIKRKATEFSPESTNQQENVKHEICSPEKSTMYRSVGAENDLEGLHMEIRHSRDPRYKSGEDGENEYLNSKRPRSSSPSWEPLETNERSSKRICEMSREYRDGFPPMNPGPSPSMVSPSEAVAGQEEGPPGHTTAIHTTPPNLMLPPLNPLVRMDRHMPRSIPASYSDPIHMSEVRQFESPDGFIHWPPSSRIGDATIYGPPEGGYIQPCSPSTSSPALGTPFSTSTGRSSLSSVQYLPLSTSYADDPRRLSVNSLLSSPTRLEFADLAGTYGIDRGSPDLDIPSNDDNTVLKYPNRVSKHNSVGDVVCISPEAYGMNGGHGTGEYYANQVTVTIPRILEPLPNVLLENQMNMLYFHHFLNHTARILVPHDCEDNPFRIILPQSKILPHPVAVAPTNKLTQWPCVTLILCICFLHIPLVIVHVCSSILNLPIVSPFGSVTFFHHFDALLTVQPGRYPIRCSPQPSCLHR